MVPVEIGLLLVVKEVMQTGAHSVEGLRRRSVQP